MLDAESWAQQGQEEAVAVAVVASSPVLRAGLRTLLEEVEGVEVVAETGDLGEVTAQLLEARILIVAPGMGTPEDLVTLIEDNPGMALLLMVGDRPADLAREDVLSLFRKPRAWGILPLEASPEELAAAIHALSEGLLVGEPLLMESALIQPQDQPRMDEEELLEPLTEREVEVLQHLAQGLANKQIALALGISEHTVKFHISGIYSKMGVTNRTEAVRQGVRKGLVVL
jgi:DNA-binding NarL/FixJ family response regulator